MGAMIAQGIRREACGCVWLMKYSNHSMEQKPKYMRKCSTLSMLATVLSGVFGGLKNDKNRITPMMRMENGYFFI